MKQRSPEWYAARAQRVTASNVGAILGIDPYRTRDDVMRQMIRAREGAEPDPRPNNPAIEWGIANEDDARACYEIDEGVNVEEAGFATYEDWAGASPDGYVGENGLVEIKCPYGVRKSVPTSEPLPHYVAQIQFQLFVTARKWCDLYQWTPHGQRVDRIHAEDVNWSALRQFYAEFLEEPAELHLEPLRVSVDTPASASMAKEWDELCEQEERAKERKKDLLAEMVAMSGTKNALFAGRKLTLVEKDGAVSYAKAIKAIAPKADLEPYRGAPSSHWRFT